MNKKLSILVFTLGFLACNQRDESKVNTNLLYFDINGYFKKETARLTKTNPKVIKGVSVNNVKETKVLKIADWAKEFAIFTNADINKASWNGSFKVEKTNKTENYTSDDKKIPVKRVVLTQENGRIKKLEIVISNKNLLYTSGDTLIYYPDSLYQIKKHQKIRLLSAKNYEITGRFKP
ncbi:hypothetical protein [Pedobacter rhodius]|uniref:Uncharacterized protein n=1 Tax=Pedobacter rhodius TaxID=3004098 RepID=A0ABT4KT17_9SPHI|nr:hypothetical protein [Pedobacter sp. SJ11]MCZ4222079.1 hypothetical protein [Pedobacter sp. SJ11]